MTHGNQARAVHRSPSVGVPEGRVSREESGRVLPLATCG